MPVIDLVVDNSCDSLRSSITDIAFYANPLIGLTSKTVTILCISGFLPGNYVGGKKVQRTLGVILLTAEEFMIHQRQIYDMGLIWFVDQ